MFTVSMSAGFGQTALYYPKQRLWAFVTPYQDMVALVGPLPRKPVEEPVQSLESLFEVLAQESDESDMDEEPPKKKKRKKGSSNGSARAHRRTC